MREIATYEWMKGSYNNWDHPGRNIFLIIRSNLNKNMVFLMRMMRPTRWYVKYWDTGWRVFSVPEGYLRHRALDELIWSFELRRSLWRILERRLLLLFHINEPSYRVQYVFYRSFLPDFCKNCCWDKIKERTVSRFRRYLKVYGMIEPI